MKTTILKTNSLWLIVALTLTMLMILSISQITLAAQGRGPSVGQGIFSGMAYIAEEDFKAGDKEAMGINETVDRENNDFYKYPLVEIDDKKGLNCPVEIAKAETVKDKNC